MNPKTLLFISLLGACVINPDSDEECMGGKCDGQGDSCSDKRYDNGVCDPQIECAVPDIDCFQTFEDDEAAAAWFAGFEAKLAEEEFRAPRTFLTPDHPRWASTRKLLDDGWEAFRENRPVGLLAEKRPGLVLIEDASPNAFVVPDLETGKAGFVVMVQTGLFETGASAEGAFGVMMHELQHVVGLHIVADTKDRLRKFYFASETDEPIGKYENDDATAREYGELWRAFANEAGHFNDERLRALPMGGQIPNILQAAIAQAGTMQVPACMEARASVSAIARGIAGEMDPISGEISLAADVPARIDQAMATLATACLAGSSRDLIDVVAQMGGQTTEAIEASMPPADVALVKGKPIIEGFSAMLIDRRSKLRLIEADLMPSTGHAWSSLRYFSAEEDADDVSVSMLRAASVEPPHAIGDFLVTFLDANGQARCNDLLARRVVPHYGVDLLDEHHGYCWRAHHVRQLAESRERARAVDHARAPSVIEHRPLPIPRPVRDLVTY
jgi:hypothetical protein